MIWEVTENRWYVQFFDGRQADVTYHSNIKSLCIEMNNGVDRIRFRDVSCFEATGETCTPTTITVNGYSFDAYLADRGGGADIPANFTFS